MRRSRAEPSSGRGVHGCLPPQRPRVGEGSGMRPEAIQGAVGAGQQAFGNALLRTYPIMLIPSTVSSHSWKVIFDPAMARGFFGRVAHEPFALDPRLHPVPPAH